MTIIKTVKGPELPTGAPVPGCKDSPHAGKSKAQGGKDSAVKNMVGGRSAHDPSYSKTRRYFPWS